MSIRKELVEVFARLVARVPIDEERTIAQFAPLTFDECIWLVSEGASFVETRRNALQRALDHDTLKGWVAVHKLARSSDPDSRDAALSVAESYSTIDGLQVAIHLLSDQYEYIQIRAAAHAVIALRPVIEKIAREAAPSKDEWVRELAINLIEWLRKGVG